MKIVLIIGAVCVALLAIVSAEKFREERTVPGYSGTCGENLNWTLSGRTLRISGQGEMTNFTSGEDTPWWNKYQTIKRVEIEEGVTSIGDYAFAGCERVLDVEIASTVIVIGDWAFESCSQLVTVDIPESVTWIGDFAFSECFTLENVVIPASVISIGVCAFEWTSITSVIIQSGVISIGEYAFSDCENLVEVTISSSVSSIGFGAFFYCDNLMNINVCDESRYFSSIDGVLFDYERTVLFQYPAGKLDTFYHVPDGVISIATSAFEGCFLESLTVSDTVISIGDSAFASCTRLMNVSLSASVSLIEPSAFRYCESLSSIEVDKRNEHFSSIDGVLFNRNHTTLIQYPRVKSDIDYAIPDGVTTVEDYAFYNCYKLHSISFPESLRSIGDYAFCYCRGLSNVTIGVNVISIGNSGFYYCGSLTAFTIGPNVKTIGASVFSGCSSLKSIFIPRSVESIGTEVFRSCKSLALIDVEDENKHFSSIDGVLFKLSNVTSLFQYPAGRTNPSYTVPDGVISIEGNAFFGSENLKSVIITGSVRSISDYAFGGCSKLEHVIIGNGVTSIGNWAFSECRQLESIIIPEGVRSIGSWAFSSCSKLKSVNISKSVESLSFNAFQSCTSLSSINVRDGNEFFSSVEGVLISIKSNSLVLYPRGKTDSSFSVPDGVRSIERSAFYNNDYLTSVTISDSVTSIGDNAFSDCHHLLNVTFGRNVVSIGDNLFYGCSSLRSVNLPIGLTSIGNSAFYFCISLSNISIPSSVNSIGSSAFCNCWHLTSITIPAGVGFIGDDAFADCYNLTFINVEDGNKCLKTIDGVLFDYSQTMLLRYPPGRTNSSYIVPDGVTEIAVRAFSASVELESVVMSDDVTVIGNYAFSGCEKLSHVEIGKSVESIGDYAFYECTGLRNLSISESVTAIGDNAFSSCSNLVDLIIPNGVISIGAESFSECASLSYVSVSDSVTTIGGGAFHECPKLTEVIIGKNVKTIGGGAFSESGIATITIPNSVKYIGRYAFQFCHNLTSISVEKENEYFKSLDGVLFDGTLTSLIQYPMGKTDAVYSIPNSVTRIESCAFCNCAYSPGPQIPRSARDGSSSQNTGLKNVIIPDSVTVIDDNAFSCTDLTNVTIGNNVNYIGESAFYSNSLASITIPGSVELINWNAFGRCYNLVSVFYEGSHFLALQAFPYCYALEMVCVGPDYKSTSFCGEDISSETDACKAFQTMFNHCYKPKYMNGELIDEMRENASEWLSKSNGCIEYHCDNESGGVRWSRCNNSVTDDIIHMCVEDKCIVRNVNEETDKWVVELDMEGVSAIEMNISEVVVMINELAGNGIDELSVGYEIDDGGYVTRIVVFVRDEEHAYLISETIKAIPKGMECSYGTLCRTKSVRVKGSKWLEISCGHQIVLKTITMMMLSFVVLMITKQ